MSISRVGVGEGKGGVWAPHGPPISLIWGCGGTQPCVCAFFFCVCILVVVLRVQLHVRVRTGACGCFCSCWSAGGRGGYMGTQWASPEPPRLRSALTLAYFPTQILAHFSDFLFSLIFFLLFSYEYTRNA